MLALNLITTLLLLASITIESIPIEFLFFVLMLNMSFNCFGWFKHYNESKYKVKPAMFAIGVFMLVLTMLYIIDLFYPILSLLYLLVLMTFCIIISMYLTLSRPVFDEPKEGKCYRAYSYKHGYLEFLFGFFRRFGTQKFYCKNKFWGFRKGKYQIYNDFIHDRLIKEHVFEEIDIDPDLLEKKLYANIGMRWSICNHCFKVSDKVLEK